MKRSSFVLYKKQLMTKVSGKEHDKLKRLLCSGNIYSLRHLKVYQGAVDITMRVTYLKFCRERIKSSSICMQNIKRIVPIILCLEAQKHRLLAC